MSLATQHLNAVFTNYYEKPMSTILQKNDEHAQAVLNFEEWCVKKKTESPQFSYWQYDP